VELAMSGENFFVVNGWQADNVQKINPENFDTASQYSTGNGSSPSSMALVEDCKGYLPLYEMDYLLVFNPCTGETIKQIDLSSYADAEDGIPEMQASIYHDGKVVVAIQKLDRNNNWISPYVGQFLVIDPSTDDVEKVIDSNIYIPGDFTIDTDTNQILAVSSGDIYIPNVFGGIERLDLEAGTAEMLITADEIDENAYPRNIAYAGNGIAYTVAFARDFVSPCFLARVDLNAGTADDDPVFTAYSDGGDITGSFDLVGLGISSQGHLYLGDRNPTNPGVQIFNADTGEFIQFVATELHPGGNPMFVK
jgi:hypothetical protein